ncbi:hypothetical protein SAMN05443094_1014 [Domibacillus enclensis]|uniref:Uncharacterized protein n=1 Tax=Domibacillus enclensis TaxID=1017273 RepID=A0A1N6N5R8_9BACI|nr:hypothetical protein SAMN05443094_1014 [Domibacillus enclensis]
MNVLGKLAQMDRFTPNEQSIATYILLHKNHILHLHKSAPQAFKIK